MEETLHARASRALVVQTVAANVVGGALTSFLPVSQPGAAEEFVEGSGLPLLIGYATAAVVEL